MKLIDSPYSLSLTPERRHVRRRKVDSVVYVNIGRDNGGVLLDLSEDGMCISVANPLAVSSEINFAVGLDENRPIEGTGQISWLSESGKSAGVCFSPLSDDSRMRIRQWLAGTAELKEKREPTIATREAAVTKAAAPTLNGEARGEPETGTAAGFSRDSESHENPTMLHSPLFFLPKRPTADEISEDFPSQPEPYTGRAEKTGPGNEGETVEAFRAAIASKPEQDEETSTEERRFRKTVIVLTTCLALLAIGAAAIVAYPKRFAELRQFTASLTGPSIAVPAAPVKTRRSAERIRRRVARRPLFVVSGPQRGSKPVRDSAIFYAPDDGGTQFSAGPSQPRWRARTSSRRLVPNEEASNGASVAPTSAYPGGNDGAATSTTATTAASSQSPPQVKSSHVGGGVVEDGPVSPTFAPLNLDGQTLNSKPVVVEAVIGKDGAVKDVRLVSSPASSLAQAVVSAVKQWRYRPFYLNGQPIEFITRITVDFESSAPKR